MKKIKFLTALLAVAIIAGVGIFYACKKEEQNKGSQKLSQLSQLYDSNLIENFRNESIAKEFLQELSKIPVKVVHGILSFNSAEDFNKVYDLIVTYTDRYDEFAANDISYSKYVQSERMPDFIMSYLFETKFDFYSLRADIEEQVVRMDRGIGIPENDDPETHYTVSPYLRTLLSPQCEVIIDDLICVHYDSYGIGIMNLDWNTLNELHQHQSRNSFDEKKVLAFCAEKQNAFFLTTVSEPTLHADFAYTMDPKTPNTVQFINYSASEAYKDMKYFWDFGDGTTSTEKNPKHTYKSMGAEYPVSLTISLNNSKALPVSTLPTIIILEDTDPSDPYITYKENTNGDVGFSIANVVASNISAITWDFGDGCAPQFLGGTVFANHTYTNNGSYTVTAEILYKNMAPSKTLTKKIEVKHIADGGDTDDCCKPNDKQDGEYPYDNNKKNLLFSIRAYNVYPCHRIYAKTINYEKNSNGKFNTKKVDVIEAGFFGTIYKNDGGSGCGTEFTFTNAWVKSKKTAYRVLLDYGLGYYNGYKVSKNSLHSWHYVYDNKEVKFEGYGTSVHDKKCK